MRIVMPSSDVPQIVYRHHGDIETFTRGHSELRIGKGTYRQIPFKDALAGQSRSRDEDPSLRATALAEEKRLGWPSTEVSPTFTLCFTNDDASCGWQMRW